MDYEGAIHSIIAFKKNFESIEIEPKKER